MMNYKQAANKNLKEVLKECDAHLRDTKNMEALSKKLDAILLDMKNNKNATKKKRYHAKNNC